MDIPDLTALPALALFSQSSLLFMLNLDSVTRLAAHTELSYINMAHRFTHYTAKFNHNSYFMGKHRSKEKEKKTKNFNSLKEIVHVLVVHAFHVCLDVPLAIAAVVAVRAQHIGMLADVLLHVLVSGQFGVALATVEEPIFAAGEQAG